MVTNCAERFTWCVCVCVCVSACVRACMHACVRACVWCVCVCVLWDWVTIPLVLYSVCIFGVLYCGSALLSNCICLCTLHTHTHTHTQTHTHHARTHTSTHTKTERQQYPQVRLAQRSPDYNNNNLKGSLHHSERLHALLNWQVVASAGALTKHDTGADSSSQENQRPDTTNLRDISLFELTRHWRMKGTLNFSRRPTNQTSISSQTWERRSWRPGERKSWMPI